MRIDIVTIFPDAVMPYSEYGVLSRAREKKLAELNFVNLRDYTKDLHRKVDDYPFGGGPGMVFMVQPLADAIEAIKTENTWIVLTSPQGSVLNMKKARELSEKEHLVIVCGRYRGVDQRFIDEYVNEEISIGDYILSGGELPSLVITESVVRLLPGVLNNDESLELDSFAGAEGQLEEDLYTRPFDYKGLKVPDVLLSGDHGKIEKWRKSRRIEKTDKKRKGR